MDNLKNKLNLNLVNSNGNG